MFNNQKLELQNESLGIQVGHDLNLYKGLSYDDIKSIFYDLFDANFPKLQKSAIDEINKRLDEFWIILLEQLKNNQNNIDINKFSNPNIQFELSQISKNIARYGHKENYNLLVNFLLNQLNNECIDSIEQISGECLEIVPKLTLKQVNILRFFYTCENIKLEDPLKFITAEEIDIELKRYKELFDSIDMIQFGDITFLQTINCLQKRQLRILHYVPSFIRKIPSFVDLSKNEIIEILDEQDLKNIKLLIQLADGYSVGTLNLSEIGNFIVSTLLKNSN